MPKGRPISPDVREEAYRLWAKTGNLARVSKDLKINVQTLTRWRNDEKWEARKARLQDKLAGQLQVMDRAKDNLVLEDAIQGIKLLGYLEEKVAEALLTERVNIESWKDVLDTMKLIQQEKRLILGEPTSRNAIEIKGMSEKDLDQNIRDMMKFCGNEVSEPAEIVKPS
jgi:hypothetical protein